MMGSAAPLVVCASLWWWWSAGASSSSLGSVATTVLGPSVREALELASLEQRLEDFNIRQAFAGATVQALLAVPITAAFEGTGPKKLQYSDRVSLPSSLGAEIARQRAEVPWHFQVSTLQGKRASCCCCPVDFRAPENVVFLPEWMFRHLGAKPFDVLLVTQVKLRQGQKLSLKVHPSSLSLFGDPFHSIPFLPSLPSRE